MKHDFIFTRLAARVMPLVFVIFSLGLTVQSVQAQPGDDPLCPALVEQALFQLGSNCGALGRNTACYGYNLVDATFSQSVPEGFFSTPADRAELVSLKTIHTSPLDLALEQWGIAVMNVQANVPDTLPGQAVTFLMLGDTEVENAIVGTAAASGPATAITQQDTELRAEPSADSNLIGQIAAGTVLQLDATNADKTWLKVTSSLGSGWINHEAVNLTAAIANLPVEGQTPLSPMQAFYFRNTPGGETTCQETPSVLAIQSPENITVDLTANGANIRLGSLVMLQILPGGDEMQLTTLEGMAILDADTPNAVNVPAGFTTIRCLDEADDLGSDGQSNDQEVGDDCAWQEPTVATPDQLLQGGIVRGAIIQLNLERGEVLAVTPTPPPGDECPIGTQITHIVSAGENLFRIGLRYRTGMGAIMQANNLPNSDVIYVGQQLIIPCGVDTGLPSIPQQPPIIITLDSIVANPVDCRPFRATSPLDGLSYGMVTFYWDAAPGATGYRVNVYNLDEKNGALVGSFTAGAGSTNLTADLTIEAIGYGFSFAWDVQALYNGQVACASQRYNVPREARPAPQPGASGLSASWACGPLTANMLIVNYSGVPAGDTSVTISFTDSMAGPMGVTLTAPPTSGSIPFSPVFTVSGGSVTSSPSGANASLPGALSC